MNTEAGKQEAILRTDFLKTYLNQLSLELSNLD